MMMSDKTETKRKPKAETVSSSSWQINFSLFFIISPSFFSQCSRTRKANNTPSTHRITRKVDFTSARHALVVHMSRTHQALIYQACCNPLA